MFARDVSPKFIADIVDAKNCLDGSGMIMIHKGGAIPK